VTSRPLAPFTFGQITYELISVHAETIPHFLVNH
jgi:hypothetical protein